MTSPPDPSAASVEVERLAALRRFAVLDTLPEQDFDDLTALAATLCGTPIALVSLVDTDRQWFKSRVGLGAVQTPRDQAFCDHAIRLPTEVMVVNDASADERFADNPLVTGEPGIRFYAGAPLVTSEGHALGTLCVIDRERRTLTEAQTQALAVLARQVMAQLDLRLQRRELLQTVARRDAALAEQQALRAVVGEREQRLARIALQVPGMVYQHHLRPDGSSCFSYASEGIREIYGVNPADVQDDATVVFGRLYADDLQRVVDSISASATELTLWDCEYRVNIPGRPLMWVHGRAMPERLADGGTLWHGFITDITARRSAQQTLQERDAALRQAQRLAQLGSWRWDGQARCSTWSEQTCRLFGVEPSQNQVQDTAFMDFVHPEDRERVMAAHLAALAGARPYDVQYRALVAGGAIRVLHARAELVAAGGAGSAPAMVGTLLDVTDRVAAEQELSRHRDQLERLVEERTHELIAARDAAEQANRAKSDFLSSMSHELRTPMNAILGFSQLLQLDRTMDTRGAGYVKEILRAGNHLLELINEVLDLARIESGRLSLSPEPLRLADLLRETQTLVEPLARERDVSLSVPPQPDIVVRADRLRLKQVLLNLLANAVKYNRAGGTVRVQIIAKDEFTVRISVHDTGIGIASQDIARLFQPFSRVGATNTEGTGIGLSISQRLVALMNGRIGVESVPGVGSEFWIELPSARLADAPPPRVTGQAGAPAPRPAHPSRVLYVEDNPANLKLVEMIVQRHPGVELLMAPSGGLGLDLARSHRPDLLLLDIHLPDIDGFQVLARLRADPATRAIPVVAVTAQAMPEDVKRVVAAGFDAYLSKPLDLAQFDALLDRMLKRGEVPPAPP